MAHYIALDAGGTKTEAILFDETGRILFRDVSSGCNAMDLGLEEAIRRLRGILERLGARIPGAIPKGAFCGVAAVDYYGASLTDELDASFPNWRIRWEDDGWGMISSTLGPREEGCCIVCGTGSCLFARANGSLHHIGGWGYLLDTGGSGYNLGRDAILAALRQSDGRGGETVLHSLIERDMGLPPERNIPSIYRGGRPYIASFAHAVFEGCRLGDAISREIFERGAGALAELTWAAETYFPETFPVVLGGGIFAAFPAYAQAVMEKASPRARLILAKAPPVFGCALEALWMDSKRAGPDVEARFLQEYRRAREE